MPQPLGGPGVGLQLNQNLYPTQLFNAPVDISTNSIAFAPGQQLPLFAGDLYVELGMYGVEQFLNTCNNGWVLGPSAGWTGGQRFVKSDGFNFRVANLLGCPVGAEISNGGTGYVQATATITPSAGTSVWAPVIGGAVSVVSVGAAGGGYGIAPLVIIAQPPGPSSNVNGVGGTAASAFAVISAGTVSAVSLFSAGSGYPSAPAAVLVPNPTDPNINSGITNATVVLGITGAGSITAAICTNNGVALTNAQIATGLTLTPAGTIGTTATLTPLVLQTVVSLTTISAAGAGYPNTNKLTTVGGIPSTSSAQTSAETFGRAWRPRPADITLNAATGALTSISQINDGGLFLAAPTPIIIGNGPITTIATVTLAMGSVVDRFVIQNAP